MKNKHSGVSSVEKGIMKERRLLTIWLILAIFPATLWLLPNPPPPVAAQSGGEQVRGTRVYATRSAVVHFTQLAASQVAAPAIVGEPVAVPEPMPGPENSRGLSGLPGPASRSAPSTPNSPTVSSPAPLQNYQAMPDIPSIPEGYNWIPPDVAGAVGISKVMATHNNNYRVLNKSDGSVQSTLSLASFWSSVGVTATSGFDPKTAYDPYNNRWILTAATDRRSATSAILVGLSQTSDPGGSYNLYRFDADSLDLLWADYPNLGFNKNWVAISVNMFTNVSSTFSETRLLAIDYPTLRAGSFSPMYFTGISDVSIFPCVTYSSSENTLYMPDHISSANARYALDTLTGTPSTPIFTYGSIMTHTVLSAWVMPSGDILPQAPEPFPGTGTRKIAVLDARIVNAVFRNNSIWYAQTVGLPAGVLTHTAAQWVRLDTGGNFVDGGRVEDPTATATNGGKWYAYPAIAVNSLNDVLLGFSQFASNQFAAAGYTFRYGSDAAGTMRDPYIYKAGEGYYEKTFGGTLNRWGDFSNSVVDPTNDIDLWTIQEYAAAQNPIGGGNGSGRWGTWWAKVSRLTNGLYLPIILK